MKICHACLNPKQISEFPAAGVRKGTDDVCRDCQPSTQVKKARKRSRR